eukprot:7383478-Prymnesium_polylepis.1
MLRVVRRAVVLVWRRRRSAAGVHVEGEDRASDQKVDGEPLPRGRQRETKGLPRACRGSAVSLLGGRSELLWASHAHAVGMLWACCGGLAVGACLHP